MEVVKVKLLLATLLSFTVGTVASATAQQIRTASSGTTRVLFNADQKAVKSTTAATTASAKMTSKSKPTTKNQLATSPAVKFSQVSYHKTIQPTPSTLAAAPLTTLAPGENLVNKVKQASGVVLLDFYADWCGPCRTQGGILHEMERTATQNNASMIKINVDQHRRLASAFKVTSMPTLILIKNGRIIERQTGVANHQRVATLLSR